MAKHRKHGLDPEEQDTLSAFEEAFERGTLKSVPNHKSELKRMQTIAKISAKKSKGRNTLKPIVLA